MKPTSLSDNGAGHGKKRWESHRWQSSSGEDVVFVFSWNLHESSPSLGLNWLPSPLSSNCMHPLFPRLQTFSYKHDPQILISKFTFQDVPASNFLPSAEYFHITCPAGISNSLCLKWNNPSFPYLHLFCINIISIFKTVKLTWCNHYG